ncbi:MAG TPA: Rieske (2Fe-2S) protein [Candidatus Limnocylindrales bacterium]
MPRSRRQPEGAEAAGPADASGGRLDSPSLTRRDFLIGSGAFVAGAALLGPAALAACGSPTATAVPPAASPRWIRVLVAGVTPQQPRWVAIDPSGATAIASAAPSSPPSGRSGAWLVLGADGSATAFDGHCTHEGCLYDWDAADARFACRCHRGYFRTDGSVISGPPPRALDRFETRAAGADAIEIAWIDRGPFQD